MKPVIVLVGEVELPPHPDFNILHYASREGYVTRLVKDSAALILVDGHDDGWRFWVTTPKTSPATRRIPVILLSDDAERRQQALLAGADKALAASDFDLSREYISETAEFADCAGQLPELARQGIEKFNAGDFYRQHDLFEELWMQTEGSMRELYRAILQVGVAYYQIQRGNYRGAVKMLLRATRWLASLPDECQGVDVAQLRADSSHVRAELERLGEQNFHQFDQRLLQPVKMKHSGQSTR
jgi:predicted metal-dependent hydrolase